MKRRISAVAALVVALGVLVGINASLGSAAPLPARQHIFLKKECPIQDISPKFVITNVTNDPDQSDDRETYAPEDLYVTIRTGKAADAPIVVDFNGPGAADDVPLKDIFVPAGQTVTVVADGAQWRGPHFAHFSAMYRGKVRDMAGRQFCHCEDDVPETTPPSSSPPTTLTTTSTSTSTTTSTSTSTTTVLPTTTTTVLSTTTTTVLSTTTSTEEPTTTTSTTPPQDTTTTTHRVPPSTTTTTGGG